MAVSLRFNAEECYRALVERLMEVADSIMEQFYKEAISGLSVEAISDSERVNAIIDETQEKIIAECKFYADALMESFGVGNGADVSSESYWKEYKSSPSFNKLRKTRTIVGRKKGKYINIYGEKQESTGANEGKNLETLHIKGRTGEYIQVKPIAAKGTIQNAENWLIRNHQRRVEDRIEEELKRFFSEEARKFFVEVSI